MIYLTPEEVKRNKTERSWFGPMKESLNLTDTFSSVPEILVRIIRTFSDYVPTLTVSSDQSYVTGDGKQMVLAAEVFGQKSFSNDLISKIFIGEFIHEMSHLRYTIPGGILKKDSTQLFNDLFNILEDKRIEQKASWEFPGFNKYLVISRSYHTAIGEKALKEMKVSGVDNFNSALKRYISTQTLYPKIMESPYASKMMEDIYKTLGEEIIKAVDDIVKEDFLELSLDDILRKAEDLEKLFKEDELSAEDSAKGGSGMSEGPSPEVVLGAGSDDIFSNSVSSDEEGESKKVNEMKEKLANLLSSAKTALAVGMPASGRNSMKIESRESVIEAGAKPAIAVVEAQAAPLSSMDYKRLSSIFKVKIKTLGSFIEREKSYYEQAEGEIDEDEISRVKLTRDIFVESDFKN